jgi:hypothetical protein
MASIENELRTYLTTSSTVARLAGEHVRPLRLPVTYDGPGITFQRISSNPIGHLNGQSGLVEIRMQINCWGGEGSDLPYANAKELAEAVKEKLDPKTGSQRPWPRFLGAYEVENARLIDEQDIIEPSKDASDRADFGVSMDFSIWYQET